MRSTAMATSSTPEPVDALLSRAARLKGELVAFAQGPRFARRLDARLFDVEDDRAAINVIDHFALQHRLSDGRTVLDRFVAQRRPTLSDDDRGMLLGWHDVVEGCFEVRRFDGDAVLLHHLADDLVYRVHSNAGRAALEPLRVGGFFVGRIVPLHPATDAWLVTGAYSPLPAAAGPRVAAAVVHQLAEDPEPARRNQALWRRAREVQAEHRADFIDQVGADLVVLPPREALDVMREHYRRQRQRAGGTGDAALEPPLSEELLSAETVALVYDEVEGLAVYRDFGRLDALFADPTPARDRAGLTLLRGYLDDDSISPLAIRRLVRRHPDGADRVFRALLRKPGFSWSKDGDQLLRRYKKAHLDREPMPGVSVVGERLAELLASR
ncbi:MAG: hypothetical protein HOV94_17440 [Saccharothrix sp.]|nr:hypothetical protein [Saccharothrix sp.]